MCQHCDAAKPWRWSDRVTSKAKPKRHPGPARSRKTEEQYSRQLRKVAREIGRIVNQFPPGDIAALPGLERALAKYAETIEPWARATANRMVSEIDRQDAQAWAEAAKAMSRDLREELKLAPTGQALKQSLDDQVHLITSLPTEAAERVHRLTLEGLTDGSRAADIAKQIAESGDVSASRATLIARTEVARTASGLTQARAEHIGSEGYIWRTSGDSDVRKSHAAMAGKFVKWDSPPTLDGMTGHAGCVPNCRCYPEPVIPEVPQ